MHKKVLILGFSGKMGTAISEVFSKKYKLIKKNSRDFNARNFKKIAELIKRNRPDIVINAVSYMGIDACEKNPELALELNTLLPKYLAGLSSTHNFLLIHFSTDAIFGGIKSEFYTEKTQAAPLNIYGLTKFGGDCFIQTIAKKYYICRIPFLFGKTNKNTQFLEKVLLRSKKKDALIKVASDVIMTPTFSKDVAREVLKIIKRGLPYGVFHISNNGKATLPELLEEIFKELSLKTKIKRVSLNDFKTLGKRNSCCIMKSNRIATLRHWKKAVKEYCRDINSNQKDII